MEQPRKPRVSSDHRRDKFRSRSPKRPRPLTESQRDKLISMYGSIDVAKKALKNQAKQALKNQSWTIRFIWLINLNSVYKNLTFFIIFIIRFYFKTRKI